MQRRLTMENEGRLPNEHSQMGSLSSLSPKLLALVLFSVIDFLAKSAQVPLRCKWRRRVGDLPVEIPGVTSNMSAPQLSASFSDA